MGEWALALAYLAAGIGAGLTTIGAGMGIGRLAASAMDGTARQPEAGGAIRTTMIIAAAMSVNIRYAAWNAGSSS